MRQEVRTRETCCDQQGRLELGRVTGFLDLGCWGDVPAKMSKKHWNCTHQQVGGGASGPTRRHDTAVGARGALSTEQRDQARGQWKKNVRGWTVPFQP